MSSTQKPQLLRSAPYFPVADVGQCSSYYERVLGFQCEYSAGAPAQFAIMSRDGFAIMFRLVSEPDRISPNETQGGTWDAFFWTRDVDALHTELRDRGAEIVYGPTFSASLSDGRIRYSRLCRLRAWFWAGAQSALLVVTRPVICRIEAARVRFRVNRRLCTCTLRANGDASNLPKMQAAARLPHVRTRSARRQEPPGRFSNRHYRWSL